MIPKMGMCKFDGCHDDTDPHHLWYGQWSRPKRDCVFQKGKLTPPSNIIHEEGCKCNLMPLCFKHHRKAHDKGDMWLYEQTKDERVMLKLQIRGKFDS